jgi:hypothetical protein
MNIQSRITFLFALSSFFIFILGSCESEKACIGTDSIDGIIDTTYELGLCFQYMHDTSYVINNVVEFKLLRNKIDSLFLASERGCDTAELIVPDFEKYTLLGIFSQVKGCDANYKRAVVDDNVQHKYIFTVEASSCGNCNYLIPSMNWVLVPKIPENYTVEFKVTK